MRDVDRQERYNKALRFMLEDECNGLFRNPDKAPALFREVIVWATSYRRIPGVRLGYLCAEPEVIERIRRKMLPWSISAQAAEIAARLPEHMDLIRQDAQVNKQRREEFCALLKGIGADALPSQSNFLLVDFHRNMSDAAAHLRSRGILVRTCDSFGLADNYLRLAVKTEAETRQLIRELEGILYAG